MAAYVTVQTIRDEVQDNSPDDNSIDNDLYFSDEIILTAMKAAARAFNAVQPVGVCYVNYNAMPTNTSIFVDATVANLYKIAVNKLIRNNLKWSTGGTTVTLESDRIEAFSKLQQALDAQWRQDAIQYKSEYNRQQAWDLI